MTNKELLIDFFKWFDSIPHELTDYKKREEVIDNYFLDKKEVEEKDIIKRGFQKYKEISDDIKVYNLGDYLLYFNYKLKTITIYEVIVEFENKKEPIIKRAKIPNRMSFYIIMNSLGFSL